MLSKALLCFSVGATDTAYTFLALSKVISLYFLSSVFFLYPFVVRCLRFLPMTSEKFFILVNVKNFVSFYTVLKSHGQRQQDSRKREH